jgi:hypothetical protein
VISGGVLSVTVTVWVAVDVFPSASIAVYVIVVVPFGKIFPAGTPLRVMLTGEQLSVAFAVPRSASLTNLSQLVAPGPVATATAAGAVTAGGVLSSTVTVWVAVALFPSASVAVYVMVVIPFGKIFSVGTPLRMIVTGEQLSEAVAKPRSVLLTNAAHMVAPGPVVAFTAGGAVITGGVVSVSVTVWVAVDVFPSASIAVYVMVVIPFGKTFPVGTPLRVMVTAEQLSTAVALPRFASLTNFSQLVAPGPVETVTAAGAVITGGVSSVTVTVCVAVAVFPLASVAVWVTVVVPTGKIFPDGTPLRVTVTPGQLSFTAARPRAASVTTLPQIAAPGAVVVTTAAGAVMVGFCVS